MKPFAQYLKNAEAKKIAIGHFNISDIATLKAIAEAVLAISKSRNIEIPVIIGTSEGEREFIDIHDAVSLVRDLRENHGQPVFLNADHTHSVEKAKEAADAGYDAILFDGGKLPLLENIKQTKEVVEYVRQLKKGILVEGELGYIGSGSMILKEIPKGAAIEEKDLTKPEEAARFVRETGVDLLAPAVGNFHGIIAGKAKTTLNFARIRAIKDAVKIPLVLHGGSSTPDADFLKAIEAGINIVHISTELRAAWRRGMEKGLKDMPDEVTPYKLSQEAIDEIKKVVTARLKLFNKLT